ncbi:glycoside hydrolase family 3 protein [bacterium]|nr:glycoside hydrolase family 3 protein [bacterium]
MENLKEKLNQMFILGFSQEQAPRELLELLSEGLGGIIFFSKNIISESQTKECINEMKRVSKYKPFIAIDEEGGRVERTENLFGGNKFLSAKFAYEKGEEFLKTQTKEISRLLANLGFNLNFAPVLDVNTNPDNPIIGERAFSSETDTVISCGNLVVNEYLKNGIIPCTKHFPGHGDTNVDSHLSLPEITMSFEQYELRHIRAFKEVESPMVMVAHIYCKCFDDEKTPASISENVLGYLKRELAYDPLVITDDMVMGGITEAGDAVETIACAIKNGVDLILYRDCDKETLQKLNGVYERAKTDAELRKNIELSFNKILKRKQSLLTF